MTADEAREAFRLLRETTPAISHPLIELLESDMLFAKSMADLYVRSLNTKADVVPFPGHSVKV